MTKENLKKEMLRIAEVYEDRFSMNQSRFEMWYDLLNDLDDEIFHEAVNRHMRCSEFAPLPASIMRQYDDVKAEWLLIMKHVRDTFNLASDNYGVYGGITKPEDFEVFKEVVLADHPYPVRESIAGAFLKKEYEYLRQFDKNAEDNHLPPFEEYIRGSK